MIKNLFKNKIFIILIYLFSLLLINNIPFFKSIIFNYNNADFQMFNINIVGSIILLIILTIIFRNGKINKNIFIYSIFLIYSYNMLSNLFFDFNAIGFLLLYLFLIFLSFATYIITNKQFEISVVISVSVLLLMFYIFGIFNILNISWIILLVVSIFCIVVIFKKSKKENILLKFQNEFLDKSLIVFSILFIVAILGGVGRFVHIWDEYSHWAYDAKIMINMNKLSTYTGLIASTRSYPPILNLWHYIVSMFCNGFSEPNLYIGLSILIFTYMMPVFKYIKNNNNLIIFLICMLVYSFPLLFDGAYSYTMLYADLLMGMITGTILIINDENNDENISILPLLFIVMTLLKPNGFVTSCVLLFLFYLIEVFRSKKIFIKEFFVKYKWCIVGVILSLITWYSCVFISKLLVESYDFTLLPESLKTSLYLKINKDFILSFFTAVISSFDETLIFGAVEIPMIFFIGVIFVLIYIVFKSKSSKSALPYIISYVVFFGLTALSLFVMFTKYEAENLASFGRYLNTFNMGLVIFIIYLFTKYNFKSIQKYFYIIIVICLFIPFVKTSFFATDFTGRNSTQTLSQERKNQFIDIIENTESDSRVYVINQTDEDSIMTMWYARYYTYPRYTNASSKAINWKIKTSENLWDLSDWGMTAVDLQNHLIEYEFDYLYLYSYTDEFFQKISFMLDNDIEDNKKYKLFKINVVNNNITLKAIK